MILRSPLPGDLLDEINFARNEIGIDAKSLFGMVTAKSASVLRLRNGEGQLRPGAVADLIAVHDKGLTPAQTVAQLTFDQVELVVLGGRVQLASDSLFASSPTRFKSDCSPYSLTASDDGYELRSTVCSLKQEELLEEIFASAERRWNMPVLHEASTKRPLQAQRITHLPILILNVHSLCNCRCVMCDIWKRETKEQIRLENLERHRLSMQRLGVKQVVLTGGEPLLHNDLAALCTFFRDQHIRLTLLTTGLLLLKRASEVATLFDDIIISLDGPQEIHDSIRRVKGAFDLIHKGVADVRRCNPSIPITCRTTVQKANHRHLRETVTAAKTWGLNSISFLAADLTSEAFNRLQIWPAEKQNQIGLTLEETIDLEAEIEQMIQDFEIDIN